MTDRGVWATTTKACRSLI